MRLFSQREIVDREAETDALSDLAAWHFYDI